MAQELVKQKVYTTLLAMHPGEVATYVISLYARSSSMLTASRDMANVSVGWEVEGIITAKESVAGMLSVIKSKTVRDTGTFWTWEGKVRFPKILDKFLG